MTSPYYSDNSCSIYLGDCRDILPTLTKNSIDLIVTDPPYGMDYVSGWRRDSFGKIAGDSGDDLDVPAALSSAAGALRDHRHLYAFGRYDLSQTPFTAAVELIWDKGTAPGMGDLTLPWGPCHEPIMFAVLIRSRSDRDAGRGKLAARLRRGSVIRDSSQNGRTDRVHPTEKPIGLLRQLIESSSVIGETVLDPFMGSGTTLEAALIEGRRAVGIECEERYAEIAAARVERFRRLVAAGSG